MIYVLIIVTVFSVEYVIKNHVEKKWNSDKKDYVLGNSLILRKHHNKGAILNMGEGRRSIVAGLSILITFIVGLFFIFTLNKKGLVGLKTGMALILGGGLSNTYDRIKRKYVVDYFSINTSLFGLKRIIFNLADFGIIFGSICTVLFTKK